MNDDQQLHDDATAALEQRAQALDGSTLSKLHQARVRAIAQGSKRRRPRLSAWLPAAGVFAAVSLVIINVWQAQPPTFVAPEPALLESLALENSRPAVDDLDFYEWLARHPNGSA